jgi:maltose/moltooligosaccharide transporter
MLWLPNSSSLTLVVILLSIFTIGINVSFQPFKPLVADIVVEREHTKVYAIQAALIGIGATAASIAPWLLLALFRHHIVDTKVPFEIKFAFYMGAVIIFIACFWTTITTRHYLSQSLTHHKGKKTFEKRLVFHRICQLFSSIPKIMWQVSLVQFFTWVSVFSFIIYLTPAIEQAIFNVPINIQHLSSMAFKPDLEKSVVLNGICCAIYMAVNIVYAYAIPFLSRIITRKKVHIFSLFIGGLSLLSFVFIHHKFYLFASMVGVGISLASIYSLPFAMIAGSLPSEKLGVYMGIFNVAICLPQIIVSLSIGFVFKSFLHGSAINVMFLSGIFMLIAALLAFFVKDKNILEIV